MVNQEVVDYIKQNLAKGFTREQIHQTLLSAGNSEQEINECFELANLAEQSVVQTKKNEEELQNKTIHTDQQSTIIKNQDLTPQNNNQEQQEAQQTQKETTNNNQNKKPAKLFFIIPIISIAVFGIIGFALFSGIFGSSQEEISIPRDDTSSEQEQIELNDNAPSNEPESTQNIEDNTHDNNSNRETQRCKISANLADVTINAGSIRGITAVGYLGDVVQVSWKIEDEEIARVAPELGTGVAVAALQEGQTKITLTDNSVGPDCSYSISLTVN